MPIWLPRPVRCHGYEGPSAGFALELQTAASASIADYPGLWHQVI